MREIESRKVRVEKLMGGLLLGFLAVALSLVFWTVWRAPDLGLRGDNPRVVERELRIRRGRILDSNGVVVAETIGSAAEPERIYPLSGVGPAVGYYSFRHGTAGVEEGYDAVLRGDSDNLWEAFWRQTMHQAQSGQDIRLTLNAAWQQAAHALLGDNKGAVVLLSLPDAEIRAMASHPDYDPNRLDEQFDELLADEDAPLLNRATQGQYQPGLALQPLIMAQALEEGLISLSEPVMGADEAVTVDGSVQQCATEPLPAATWADVLRASCPAPMVVLSQSLTASRLQQWYQELGLLSRPQVPLATAEIGNEPLGQLEQELIGQGNLTVSPLQVALAWAALANQGELLQPQLVSATESETGEWQAAAAAPAEPRAAIAGWAAQATVDSLAPSEGGVIEYATLALAGPEGGGNAWYLGLAPAADPQYALVVVLEDADDVAEARQIGRSMFKLLLAQS